MSAAEPRRALAIGAHSDDVEFGCGATLAKLSAAGCEVHIAVLTDGSKGTWDPDASTTDLVGTRRREQEDAARVLGVTEVHFLDYVDGELEPGRKEQAAVCDLIRTTRPDVVLTHDPWKQYRLHPDHKAAGEIALAAIVAARDPHFFPDQGTPHRPSTLLLFEAQLRDHTEAVEDAHLVKKVAALLCHRSQLESTMDIAEGSPDEQSQRLAFQQKIRDEAEAAGTAVGLQLGEPFKLLREL